MLLVVVVVLSVLTDGCRAFEDWDQYEIVWRDEFDFMDLKNWQYEVTCSGGGVSIYTIYTEHCSVGPTNFIETIGTTARLRISKFRFLNLDF